MPTAALLIALASAGVHAGWNVLLSRARDSEAATAVTLMAGAMLFAPVAAATWRVEAAAVPYLAGSAALELLYFGLLATAYDAGLLSVIYPVARGSAPLLIALLGAVILGALPSAVALTGVVLVALGVALVRGGRTPATRRDTAFALAIGATIAGYTLLDRAGLRHAGPLPYLELVVLPAAVAYPLLVRARRGAGALRAELGPATLLAGAGLFGAYGLTLAALRLTPQAYVPAVGAARETSVVIAVALAALVLREPVGSMRMAGAAVVVAGVVLLAVG